MRGARYHRESAIWLPLQSGHMSRSPFAPLEFPMSGCVRAWLAIALALWLAGCSGLVSRAGTGLGADLAQGIADQDDPATVAEGLPAYLLLLDGLISGDPANAGLLLSASRLYAAYAGSFVDDPERRKRLALRADDYARRAVCADSPPLCAALDAPYEEFVRALAQLRGADLPLLHAYAAAQAGVLQADASDWERIARLPQIEAAFLRVDKLDPAFDGGSAAMYLGVLNCLRPESLGGNPARGQDWFQQAVARSQGHNLMARVLDAQFCARLAFDQARHDGLLNEVLAADPRAPGLTLSNTLAQQQARLLLESGKDYF